MVWARIEKRRRIRRQESDGDGCAGEKKERKTKAEVDGYHRERLVGERIIKGGDRTKPLIIQVDDSQI